MLVLLRVNRDEALGRRAKVSVRRTVVHLTPVSPRDDQSIAATRKAEFRATQRAPDSFKVGDRSRCGLLTRIEDARRVRNRISIAANIKPLVRRTIKFVIS